MPKPRHPTYDQMASTSEDAKWVELEGTVRSAVEVPPDQRNSRHLRLNLVMDGDRLMVEIPESTASGAVGRRQSTSPRRLRSALQRQQPTHRAHYPHTEPQIREGIEGPLPGTISQSR